MRAPAEAEILVAIVAGQLAAPLVGLSIQAPAVHAAEVVESAEALVSEVMRRTDEREKLVGFHYECRHGHVTTHEFKIDEAAESVECGESHRSNDYDPCTKTAGLIGRADGGDMPAELPPSTLLVDQHWTRNQLGRDRRHGISVDFREGTLTPEEVAALEGAVITAIEQWMGDGSPLTLLHDDSPDTVPGVGG